MVLGIIPAFAYAAGNSSFTTNLQLRQSGTEVLLLQKFLNSQGFVIAQNGPGAPGNETTYFGVLTYRALRKYQSSVGVPDTGFFGPLTRAAISTMMVTPTAASPASSSEAPAQTSAATSSEPIIPFSMPILTGYQPGFGGGGKDTIAPTVSITSPSNGSTVGGSVSLIASASDNVAVASVQFKVDGSTIGSAIASVPYSVTWSSTGVSDGSHTVSAVATDAAGNSATALTTVTIDNTAPIVSAISTSSLATTSVSISWTTNEGATSQINYGTTSSYGSTANSSSGTSHTIALSNLAPGTLYHYQIESVDGVGNIATTSDRTFLTLTALNSRVVFLGDSITAGSVGPSYIYPSLMYSGGRYYAPPSANQGVGGNTTAQMLTRIASSTSLSPKVLVVLGGTNDITGLGSPASTIETNLRSIYNDAEAAGAHVVAITITPRSDSTWQSNAAAYEAVRTAVNSWIKSQSDVTAVDMDAAGFNSTTMTVEGLHPNRVGAYAIGQQVGAALANLADSSSILYSSPSDWNNVLANNSLVGTNGSLMNDTVSSGSVTGQVAAGWTVEKNVGGINVAASVSTSSGYAVQTVTISGTATSSGIVIFREDQNYTGAIGDVYDLWANVSVSGLSGAVAGFFSGADGVFLWEPNSSNGTSTTNFSGVVRNFGQALTSSRTLSRAQWGLYITQGVVNAAFTVSQPTWRIVPNGQ